MQRRKRGCRMVRLPKVVWLTSGQTRSEAHTPLVSSWCSLDHRPLPGPGRPTHLTANKPGHSDGRLQVPQDAASSLSPAASWPLWTVVLSLQSNLRTPPSCWSPLPPTFPQTLICKALFFTPFCSTSGRLS